MSPAANAYMCIPGSVGASEYTTLYNAAFGVGVDVGGFQGGGVGVGVEQLSPRRREIKGKPLLQGDSVAVGVGVSVTFGVGVGVDVDVAFGVGVGVNVTFGVGVGVDVTFGVGVGVDVTFGVGVAVGVNVGLAVGVGV